MWKWLLINRQSSAEQKQQAERGSEEGHRLPIGRCQFGWWWLLLFSTKVKARPSSMTKGANWLRLAVWQKKKAGESAVQWLLLPPSLSKKERLIKQIFGVLFLHLPLLFSMFFCQWPVLSYPLSFSLSQIDYQANSWTARLKESEEQDRQKKCTMKRTNQRQFILEVEEEDTRRWKKQKEGRLCKSRS